MEQFSAFYNPALTVALALLAGVAVQALAQHIRLPGIVFLLVVGVLLGPDGLGLVRPSALGGTLLTLVGFAVAVILFEGGMNLNIRRLRRERRVILQLLTIGALVTALGGTLAAYLLFGWSWQLSALFGTLVIVTGPTVIKPLLQRIRVQRSVATVLEAEGVLIDAIGALAATIALELVIEAPHSSLLDGLWALAARLGLGTALGLLGGALISLVLRFRSLIPEGLRNIFTLSMVLVLFQTSAAIIPEGGVTSVVVAGIVVGNTRSYVQRELMEFKEQLTIMLIGMLFILLAADVRLADVRSLGLPGALVVALLILLVRPLSVLASTTGTELNTRQKAFLAWVAPRGIVAAAVSSLFAEELERSGLPGGEELRAMVFLVIAVTGLWSGLTSGFVARLLGLRRPADRGWVILGANELARALGDALQEGGQSVILIDTNPEACQAAQLEGLPVLFGNGLKESLLTRAEIDTRAGAIGLTPNSEVNLLFLKKVKEQGKVKRLYAALGESRGDVSVEMLQDELGGTILFGAPQDIGAWMVRLRRKASRPEWWRLTSSASLESSGTSATGSAPDDKETPRPRVTVEWGLRPGPVRLPQPPESLLLIAARRDGEVSPFHQKTKLSSGDDLLILINGEKQEEAETWLSALGFERLPAPTAPPSPKPRGSVTPTAVEASESS